MLIREMTIEDYNVVFALWQSDKGMYLDERDSKEGIQKYLNRNPGLSFVAYEGPNLIGAILGGHDGRNAEFHHIIVDPQQQNQGIGRKLAEFYFKALAKQGIINVNVFVKEDNSLGGSFMENLGFQRKGAICYSLQLLPILADDKT